MDRIQAGGLEEKAVKTNYIQFQPGMSLDEFNSDYGSVQQCESALEKSRWPEGYRCSKCNSEHYSSHRRGHEKVFQCSNCRAQITLIAGTIFDSTKLPLTKWFQTMYLMSQSKNNIAMLELHRLIGISYRAAWRMKQKIMQAMQESESTTKLSNRVVVDDSYLGGENPGGKPGRGSENKIPFIAAIQTNNQNNPLYAVFSPVATFSKEEILAWAARSLVPGTIVVSDGLSCFPAVEDVGCHHQQEVVGKGNKSTSMEVFNWVNTILGNLKTAIAGTYHMFDFEKYAYRYLGTSQYLFNHRFDLSKMFSSIIRTAAHTGKRTEHFLRAL